MKKFCLILLTLTALTACSKGGYNDYDFLGGHISYTSSSAGRSYMMSIADGLMAGVLDELSLARETQQRGTATSSHFEIKGGLYTAGSTWTVYTESSQFKGLVIRCTGEKAWDITYEGDFQINGAYYPTAFSMTASLTDDSIWMVSLSGDRTERGGYTCQFETRAGVNPEPVMSFANTMSTKESGWNRIKGDLFLTVYKNKEVVDVSRLSFNGTPSQATYTRGL